jgi:hypothetical protein
VHVFFSGVKGRRQTVCNWEQVIERDVWTYRIESNRGKKKNKITVSALW